MKKNTKKDIENAICYIRDYAHGLKERSKSDVSKRLCYAINTIIEDYNELEQVEMERAESAKLIKLLLPLVFDRWDLNHGLVEIEEAAKIPAEYYARRITAHYLEEADVSRMFYLAYRDYQMLQSCMDDLDREKENMRALLGMKKSIEKKEDSPSRTSLLETSNLCIEQAEENLSFYRSEIERLS